MPKRSVDDPEPNLIKESVFIHELIKIMNPLHRSLRLALLAATVMLASCAATVRQPTSTNQRIQSGGEGAGKIVMTVKGSDIAAKSPDWELLRAEWRTGMSMATRNAGLAFSYQEIAPKTGSDRATSVSILVNDYRYISPGARYGFGVMTGNAYMDSEVTFIDVKTGKNLGTKKYSTSSTAWQGVFSAMTDKQIQAICAEIVNEVSKR